jgi:mannose-1-phosphate guanylyltransferase/phosphomannomutase
MAGGFGTRLRPLTVSIPKPMTPLLNKPIIEHNVELLKLHGITDLVIILYYQSEVIREHFGDGSKFGVSIRYVKPDADYGTAGAVYQAEKFINGTVLIISGDVVTDFGLSKAVKFHEQKKAYATVVLTHSENPLQYGIVLTGKDGKITKFYEKPTWAEVFSDTINTGIYVLDKSVFSLIPQAKPQNQPDVDFSKNLFPFMLSHRLPLYGHIASGYWRDVGGLDDYISANLDSLKGKVNLPGMKNLVKDGNVISKTARISKTATIKNSIIGDNCEAGAGCSVRSSILWNNVRLEDHVKLNKDVVCNDVSIKKSCSIGENVFIGEKVNVGANSAINPDIRIWPNKVIDSGSLVIKNLIWEERWKDTLFTDSRITGLANLEITSEFGAKLGRVFAAHLGEDARVQISRDTDDVSRMIKGAIISGLMSGGNHVLDQQTIPIPVLRQELRAGKGAGGIFIRKSPFDASKCDIIFFDSTGKDLSSAKTKSIERLFFSEDFKPVPFDRIGSVAYPERTFESYKEHFMSHIDKQRIESRKFKIVVNYSHGITASLFPVLLRDFNIEIVSLDTHLDPSRQTRSQEEFKAALAKLAFIVTSLKYDAGFLLDAGGEKIFLVDNKGTMISYDRFLSIIVNLFLSLHPDTRKIAVPIQASGEIDIVARNYGTQVIRVKDSHFAMMNAANDPEVKLIGGTKGGVIFPEFSFATDGMFSVMKILELLAASGKTLSELDKETPKLYMYKANLPCSREQKGKVMRMLVEESEGMKRELIDGIKIFFDDLEWVLCIPDSERELLHINAEAGTLRKAKSLVNRYSKKVSRIVKQ